MFNNGHVNCTTCKLNFMDENDKRKSIGNVYEVFQAWKVNKCCNEETWY